MKTSRPFVRTLTVAAAAAIALQVAATPAAHAQTRNPFDVLREAARKAAANAPAGMAAASAARSMQTNSVNTGSPSFEVIATGLDNPNGLDFDQRGALYVAEAGRGGDHCVALNPFFTACTGNTGAITRIWKGKQERVLTGLPSLAGPEGFAANGPIDISLKNQTRAFILTSGAGFPRELCAQFGPECAQLGLAWQADLKKGEIKPIADLTAFEYEVNPDGAQPPDSNPYGILLDEGKLFAVDAAGNTLLRVKTNGTISTEAVFPVRDGAVPPGLPPEFGFPPAGTLLPMQSVPTAVTAGPDGALYVGELTGFPFPLEDANVYRVVPGEAPEVWCKGFTAIVDLEFDDDGNLYVLEIAKNGILDAELGGGFKSAIIKVTPDGTRYELPVEGLVAATGLAIGPDGALYVSNFGIFPGQGQVVRIQP